MSDTEHSQGASASNSPRSVAVRIGLPTVEELEARGFPAAHVAAVRAAIANNPEEFSNLQYSAFTLVPPSPWQYAIENESEAAMDRMLDWGLAHCDENPRLISREMTYFGHVIIHSNLHISEELIEKAERLRVICDQLIYEQDMFNHCAINCCGVTIAFSWMEIIVAIVMELMSILIFVLILLKVSSVIYKVVLILGECVRLLHICKYIKAHTTIERHGR